MVKAARAKSAGADHEDTPDDQPPFEDVEPWDTPVNGQELFDEIAAALDRHVVLQPGQAAAVALWIMLSWVFERFKILPQLLLCSPVKRCGKTTLLELISYMVARATGGSKPYRAGGVPQRRDVSADLPLLMKPTLFWTGIATPN